MPETKNFEWLGGLIQTTDTLFPSGGYAHSYGLEELVMLICPKCHKKLRHIGVDYDRPAVVYTCKDCENSFTSPITKSTCCYCQSTFPVNALVPRDVEDYEITEEGIRTLTSGNIMFNNMVNIYDNLNRMHRQPRPWANVNISMMQSMHIFVHEWDMKQPMDPIKVKTFPDWDQQKQGNKPNRMGRPGQHGRIAVCQSPKH